MQQEEIIRNVLKECFAHIKNPDEFENYFNYRERRYAVEFAIDFFEGGEIPERVIDVGLRVIDVDFLGFLWCTNRRLFFAGQTENKMFKKPQPDYRQFSYESIARVQFERGGFLSSAKIILHIYTTSARGKLETVSFSSLGNRDKVHEFVDYVTRKRRPLASQTAEESDFITQLERLGRLKTEGLISQEEFQVAKKKLLNCS